MRERRGLARAHRAVHQGLIVRRRGTLTALRASRQGLRHTVRETVRKTLREACVESRVETCVRPA